MNVSLQYFDVIHVRQSLLNREEILRIHKHRIMLDYSCSSKISTFYILNFLVIKLVKKEEENIKRIFKI